MNITTAARTTDAADKPEAQVPLAAANCSPVFALSIRQPWAWLILHAGRNIENSTWPTRFRGRVLIHASKGCTQSEWADAHYFMNLRKLGADVPEIRDLDRGGIVGECEIVDCVTASDSPWFVGKYGFVLRNAKPLPFRACKDEMVARAEKRASDSCPAPGSLAVAHIKAAIEELNIVEKWIPTGQSVASITLRRRLQLALVSLGCEPENDQAPPTAAGGDGGAQKGI